MLAFYAGGLTLAALLPMDTDAVTPRFLVDLSPGLQNFLHVPSFALLVLLGLRTFDTGKGASTVALCAWVGGGSLLYSVLLEAAQAWVPGRYASLGDLLYNAVGIAGAIFLYSRIVTRGTHGL